MSLERAYTPLRSLELTDDEVAAVLTRARRARPRLRRRPRVLAPAILATCVAAGAIGLAVPAARAELSDAIKRFLAGGEPPGEPVARDEVPAPLRDHLRKSGAEPRVVARSGDERLLAYRAPSGAVCFDFGGRVGFCTPYDDLLDDGPVTVWGPTHKDEQGRWVLWGITAESVRTVELRYAEGPPTRAPVTSGFVLRADADREWRSLVGYDRAGRMVDEVDVRKNFRLAPVGL